MQVRGAEVEHARAFSLKIYIWRNLDFSSSTVMVQHKKLNNNFFTKTRCDQERI